MRNQGDNLRRFGGEARFNSTSADLLHQHIESLRERAERASTEPPDRRLDEVFFWI